MLRTIFAFLLSILLTTPCVGPSAPPQNLQATLTADWALLTASATTKQLRTPVPTSTLSPSATITETPSSTPTLTENPALTPSPAPTQMPQATSTFTPAPPPATNSLSATVSVRFLSCRYGPGPEYLYLYALRGGANIKLIGRTDGDNWHWAWVDGRNKCWVNTNYLVIQGDWRQLPIVYPGIARLPVSPYYPPTTVTSARRSGNAVTIDWREIPLRAGDEEDDSMLHYIVEAWHCRGGVLLFEPFATNDTDITIRDEPGCAQPSHARVFVQEKHGFSGPSAVPWPPP